jgi:hypothetical protein
VRRARVGGAGNEDLTAEVRPDPTEVRPTSFVDAVQSMMLGAEAAGEQRQRTERAIRRVERQDRVRAVRRITMDVCAVLACLIGILLLGLIAYRIYDRQYLDGALAIFGVML